VTKSKRLSELRELRNNIPISNIPNPVVYNGIPSPPLDQYFESIKPHALKLAEWKRRFLIAVSFNNALYSLIQNQIENISLHFVNEDALNECRERVRKLIDVVISEIEDDEPHWTVKPSFYMLIGSVLIAFAALFLAWRADLRSGSASESSKSAPLPISSTSTPKTAPNSATILPQNANPSSVEVTPKPTILPLESKRK
jgi:hypothetical protein